MAAYYKRHESAAAVGFGARRGLSRVLNKLKLGSSLKVSTGPGFDPW